MQASDASCGGVKGVVGSDSGSSIRDFCSSGTDVLAVAGSLLCWFAHDNGSPRVRSRDDGEAPRQEGNILLHTRSLLLASLLACSLVRDLVRIHSRK